MAYEFYTVIFEGHDSPVGADTWTVDGNECESASTISDWCAGSTVVTFEDADQAIRQAKNSDGYSYKNPYKGMNFQVFRNTHNKAPECVYDSKKMGGKAFAK